jgi:hypothetical protein
MESSRTEVKQLIEKLVDRFNNLPDGRLHPLDADLILSMLRQLYEKTEELRDGPHVEVVVKSESVQVNPTVLAKPKEIQENPVEVPPVTPSVVPPLIVPAQPEAVPDFKPSEQQHFSAPAPPEITLPFKNELPSNETATREEKPVSKKPQTGSVDLFGTPTIADRLKSDTPSINDKITSGKSDHTLADQIQLKPISDMKSAISLNEKFQFINELFEGSSDRYSEAINLLNSCAGREDSGQLFADLKSRYNWDDQYIVYKKLHEFVIRRYLNA